MMNVLFLNVACLLVTGISCQSNYTILEANLLTELFKNYKKDARPNATTVITIRLYVFSLKKLDIGNEVFSLHGSLSSTWMDERLKWNPITTGLYTVVTKAGFVWVPTMIIENEIENVGLVQNPDVPARIYSPGIVAWYPPILSTSSCSADITYFPYDKQKCSLSITGWGYIINEVDIVTTHNSSLDFTHYAPHGEWELIRNYSEATNLTDGEYTHMVFKRLTFNLVFRRKWPFYGQNVMLPVVLNSILMATVFRLPLDSGEKISFSLTVLLSYIVLLTMVSANLPSISSQVSILQVYLSVVLCLGTASTLCTIAVLSLFHHDPAEPVPGWLKVLLRFCHTPTSCRPKRVSSGDNTDKPGEFQTQNAQSINFKQAAKKLDQIFFFIFSALILLITVGVLLTLMIQYEL